ncbi:MAG: Fe-S protein assembly co-chaperone HscB [Rickettsiales bacterium]|nr:Fe-S protein assembly co-chaperone HscB [Rickettsiales bacterium]|tara:strand:+ start:2963 stop:3580 length:618 start_codon:yes stop_codon:yes gene_type:complete
MRCDECDKEMAAPLFCDHCGCNYPERRALSPFAILSLPGSFFITDQQLDERELELSRRLHPDRWQGQSSRVHGQALIAQSAVNEALIIVRDPLQRARALLSQRAEELVDRLTREQRLDQGFLIEQLELQEEAREQPDESRKKELKKLARGELKLLTSTIENCFHELEGAAKSESQDELIARALHSMAKARYWRNLQQALRNPAPH